VRSVRHCGLRHIRQRSQDGALELLLAKGFVRIQRSVFIGRPLPPVLRDVERSVPRFIKGERDVVHLIPMVEVSVKNMRVYGHPLADVTVVRMLLVVE